MALVKCKECDKEISSDAATCPHCGIKITPNIDLKAKVKTTDIIAAIVVVAVALWWLIPSNKKESPSAVAAPVTITPRPVMIVSAQELYAAYESNEVATDEKLKGYTVRIDGIVDSIDKDFSNSISVKLRTSNQFNSVHIGLLDKEKTKAIALNRGTKAVFECESFKRIIGSPIGENCQFSLSK